MGCAETPQRELLRPTGGTQTGADIALNPGAFHTSAPLFHSPFPSSDTEGRHHSAPPPPPTPPKHLHFQLREALLLLFGPTLSPSPGQVSDLDVFW